ncbi:MAG: branched-chain amino acid ABC transporter permease [Armatimonadota bacterium]|nr:branched-chain amino acid ABC transporter permease [Armatimonadota bacterium]MDR7456552.1 branched-chain amino acid ABC transporter permease [Armatimonadota bacterium]MDR7495865.1 branched-chain amino acid ABC transporter permease [Armatimonadota bacterium]MDR7512476.1 branched-chain amino acid ABC transporter permease [Armatimonadota bacterium]
MRSSSPTLRAALVAAYVVGTGALVAAVPRSLPAFLLFMASMLLVYRLEVPPRFRAAAVFAILVVIMPVVGTSNTFYLEVATQVGIFVALALGLNIVVGLAGLLDLGYVAFYAVGAYAWAIFGSPQALKIWPAATAIFPLPGWWFFPFLLVAVALAALTGVLLGLPVLRVRGDYLAIVTLGFGEVIRVLANNLDKPVNITNGPIGITPVGRPPLFFAPVVARLGVSTEPAFLYPLYFYFLVMVIVLVVILVTQRFKDSHIGRAWEAIREDEAAAVAMGIPLVPMKLLAFAAGASFAGAMGALFGAKQLFINPESFTFMESIGVLAMVILGGMGSIPGAILGASAVTILNLQVLKQLSLTLNAWKSAGVSILGFNLADLPTQLEPAKYERMVFGVILIAMMIFRQQGILPSARRRMEIEEARAAAAEQVVTGGSS